MPVCPVPGSGNRFHWKGVPAALAQRGLPDKHWFPVSVLLCPMHCCTEHSYLRLQYEHQDDKYLPLLTERWHHPDPWHLHRQ